MIGCPYIAFAVPNQDFDLVFTQNDSEELLHRLVAAAHEQGRNVKLSVGGWTGSTHFSRAVRNSAGRSKLCRSIVSAYSRFHLDGIDIDWEYPYSTGAGNENSPDDSANFLKLLKLLREELPADARITVAGPLWPFAGEDGEPMRDMTEFADVLDWILIMNYDVWGCEYISYFWFIRPPRHSFSASSTVANKRYRNDVNSLAYTWPECTFG